MGKYECSAAIVGGSELEKEPGQLLPKFATKKKLLYLQFLNEKEQQKYFQK